MELLDIYNSKGEKTGRIIERGNKNEKFNEDEHIAVSIIYIENDNNEFLIQKTSKEKDGRYSSTGGHINHGETPYECIVREVKEELGINIENDNVIDLGFICVDFPLRYIFYLKKNIDINTLKIQKEEVDYVEYMSIDRIKEIIKNKNMHEGHIYVLEKVLEYKKKIGD